MIDINSMTFTYADGEVKNDKGEVMISKEDISSNNYKLDNNGNLIDDEGKVVKEIKDFIPLHLRKKEVTKLVTERGIKFENGNWVDSSNTSLFPKESLIVDGKPVLFDKDGNQVAEDGTTILMSKDEVIDKLYDSLNVSLEEELTEIELLEKATGIELTDEKGTKLSFENNLEGFKKRESLVHQKGVQEGEKTAIDKFFKANPEIYDAFVYKQTYGKLDGFGNFTDYSKYKLDETNKDQLKDVIIQARLAKGDSKEDALFYYEAKDNAGKAIDTAKDSLKYLQDKQAKEIEDGKLRTKAQEDQEEREYNNYITTVSNTIKSGKIKIGENDIIIPENIKVKTKDSSYKVVPRDTAIAYILSPIKEAGGKTMYEIVTENLPIDYLIYDALKLMAGGEDEFISQIIKQNKVNEIKNQFFSKDKKESFFRGAKRDTPANKDKDEKIKHASN